MNLTTSYRLLLIGSVAALSLLIYAADSASPFYDYRAESPGTVHKITVNDLPAPNATPSGVASPEPEQRPANATLKTLPGNCARIFCRSLSASICVHPLTSNLSRKKESRTGTRIDVYWPTG